MYRTAFALIALASACRVTLEDDYVAPLESDGGMVSIACTEAAAELHPTATFLYTNTFKRNCTGNSCHDASQPEAGLDLSSASAAVASMVNVDADEDDFATDMKLVVPGEPTKSYLMLRVHHYEPEEMDPPQEPVPASERLDFYMPQDISAGLCEGKRGALERWITDGAPM